MKYLINKILLIVLLLFSFNVSAKENITYININDFTYSSDNVKYSNIKKYSNVNEFKKENTIDKVYLTTFLYDGVSNTKIRDIDEYIEEDSNDIVAKDLELNVLNINDIGNYEISGISNNLMIAINTNNLKGNINIILNNVNIDSGTKKAPVIYVYNKDINYTDCKVTIVTKKDTKNYLEGGALKKVSLVGSDELDKYDSYYSGDSLEIYNKYTSYYGVYNSSEVNEILFAKVYADSEGLRDNDPYVYYKASGAISSDIDLYFNGEGYLKVVSKNKEGIETKGNLIFEGGSGDYEIEAQDDCLNTTTSSAQGSNIRNTITIDVNSLTANVSDEAEEGDAIDSNGILTINGGNIYAYAHKDSQDSGLDSGSGTYLNGGTILATGNMADEVSKESKLDYIYVTLNDNINANDKITIKDEKDNEIISFVTTKSFSTLLYSSEELNYKSFKIYKNDEEIKYSESSMFPNMNSRNDIKPKLLIALIIEITLLIITLSYAYISTKRQK